MERRYSIGSLFSGIGGFELGLERSIPGAYTAWQVEQEEYCQKVLSKRWPDAKIFDDVRTINTNNVEKVDILCGGFPCQDISLAGTGGGINAERSGLWWEFHRIINELQPRAAIMENVPAITFRGLGAVSGSLSEIRYDCEWCVISAAQFGAPHKRERWFCVAYPRGGREAVPSYDIKGITDSSKERFEEYPYQYEQAIREPSSMLKYGNRRGINEAGNRWEGSSAPSPVCRVDDGIPHRLDRLRALGNAIVPQCSEWIGKKIWESGILL